MIRFNQGGFRIAVPICQVSHVKAAGISKNFTALHKISNDPFAIFQGASSEDYTINLKTKYLLFQISLLLWLEVPDG